MRRPFTFLLVLFLTLGITTTVAQAKNPAPEGRTYFVLVMGLNEDPYRPEPDCLSFGATQACTLDGDTCLDWQRLEEGSRSDRESAFSFTTQIDDDGVIITIQGLGRVDSIGPRSSLALVAHASALDVRVNFTLTGRQVGPARCRQMAEDFRVQGTGP